jgi:beta-glucanase (GH16 family)
VGKAREWPGNGEIDIMEFYRSTYHANLAWGSAKRWTGIWNAKPTPIEQLAKDSGFPDANAWTQAFHVYRMDWDAERIRLFVDDRLLSDVDLKTTINESADRANPFHEPHDLILNLAIGATGGDPNGTSWPSQFVVDWVRVFRQKAR